MHIVDRRLLGGYVSGATSQSESALTSIRVAVGAIPAAFILIATAVMVAYPLNEKVLRRMVAEVAGRRARLSIAGGQVATRQPLRGT